MLLKVENLLLLFLFIIGVVGVSLLFNHGGFSQKLMNYNFLLLVISTVIYLKGVKNED